MSSRHSAHFVAERSWWHELMVQLQRVGDGDLQLGVVILSFAVQVDPDAGHGKGMS